MNRAKNKHAFNTIVLPSWLTIPTLSAHPQNLTQTEIIFIFLIEDYWKHSQSRKEHSAHPVALYMGNRIGGVPLFWL